MKYFGNLFNDKLLVEMSLDEWNTSPNERHSNPTTPLCEDQTLTAFHIRQKHNAGAVSLRIHNAILCGLDPDHIKRQPDLAIWSKIDGFLAALNANECLPIKGIGPAAEAALKNAFREEMEQQC